MNVIGGLVGNVASGWIASTIEGAKDAAAAYGGNLAGDVIIAGGSLVANAGGKVGDTVGNYASRYGNWVNGYGDKIRGAPPSSMPKAGPLARYKAGGVGSSTLKRSASYGPSTSTSKELTKTTSTLPKKKVTKATKGLGLPPANVKPYGTYVRDKDKSEDKDKAGEKGKALSKQGNSKYPTSGSGSGAKSATKGLPKVTYPKGPSSLNRTNSSPSSKDALKAKPDSGPAKTSNGKYPSGPKKDSYTPYKGAEKPKGLASKAAGGGHIPLTGGMGNDDTKSESGASKGYKPYSAPAKGPSGESKGYKPYAAPAKGPTGGGGGGGSGGGGDFIPMGGIMGKSESKPSAGAKPSTGAGGGGKAGGSGDAGGKDMKVDRTFF